MQASPPGLCHFAKPALLKTRQDQATASRCFPGDVNGYTGKTGDPDQNLELASNRVKAVQDALMTEGLQAAMIHLRPPLLHTVTGATGSGTAAEARREGINKSVIVKYGNRETGETRGGLGRGLTSAQAALLPKSETRSVGLPLPKIVLPMLLTKSDSRRWTVFSAWQSSLYIIPRARNKMINRTAPATPTAKRAMVP